MSRPVTLDFGQPPWPQVLLANRRVITHNCKRQRGRTKATYAYRTYPLDQHYVSRFISLLARASSRDKPLQ